MPLKEFNRELRERMLAFLWRQWAQLGLASAQVESRDGWVILPEALLLLSGTVARWDPRLLDEIIDWLTVNASFVNFPQIKSISRSFRFQSTPVVSAIVSVVQGNNSRLRWRLEPPEPVDNPQPLFWRNSQPAPTDLGPTDKTFLRFGFARGTVNPRGLSRRFNPVMPESALLRLRALLGVTARAEILTYLCTHGASHPTAISRETGYSQKNIQDTLVDMAASQVVHIAKLEGRKKTYFVSQKDRATLLYNAAVSPIWITWPPVFRALEIAWWKLLELERAKPDTPILSIELRDLKDQLQLLQERAGVQGVFREDRGIAGDAFIEIFLEDMDAWLTKQLNETP